MPALLALLLVSCAHEVYACSTCGPSTYQAHGLPSLHTATVVRECFRNGCTKWRLPATPHHDQGVVANYRVRMIGPPRPGGQVSPGSGYLDGTTMTVTVRSQGQTWTGAGRLRWVRPSDDDVCGCEGLAADVTFTRDTPRA